MKLSIIHDDKSLGTAYNITVILYLPTTVTFVSSTRHVHYYDVVKRAHQFEEDQTVRFEVKLSITREPSNFEQHIYFKSDVKQTLLKIKLTSFFRKKHIPPMKLNCRSLKVYQILMSTFNVYQVLSFKPFNMSIFLKDVNTIIIYGKY